MKRKLIIISIAVSTLTAGWLLLTLNCPGVGIALTSNARQLHRLKNRTSVPRDVDFDPRVTIDALLQPGTDSDRWSVTHAARIQGEVIDVAYARAEATNCFSPCRRDIHIVVAKHKGAQKNEQIILEVTPNLRESVLQRGIDWSEKTLQAALVGHWCEFEGWLYFDVGHAKEAENTSPQDPTNWRATAWEIHPVTSIKVMR
jgi:hypothetical protein